MEETNSKKPYKLVRLKHPFSGIKCSIYSIYLIDEKTTLFSKFSQVNSSHYFTETMEVLTRLTSIGSTVGALEDYFKFFEGRYGDNVCCLYDIPEAFLRLFCIRYSEELIILGGGSHKYVNAWQDDPALDEHGSLIIEISKDIRERIKKGNLKITDDGFYFEGNIKFD